MTMQAQERILIDGETHYMSSEPLSPYLKEHPYNFEVVRKPNGRMTFLGSSGNHRRYVGTWLIQDNKLWLYSLWSLNNNVAVRWVGDLLEFKPYILNPEGCEERGLPNPDGPVLAKWYSGFLHVGNGAHKKDSILDIVQEYERYLVFKISNGNVEGIRHMTYEETSESGWGF